MKRRDFIKVTGAGSLGSIVLHAACQTPGKKAQAVTKPSMPASFGDPDITALANTALDAARSAGASYTDIRIAAYRNQSVSSREKRVTGISDSESRGFGIRVIAEGTWGFAASAKVTEDEVVRVARAAVAMAKANAVLQKEPIQLAKVSSYVDTWKTPIQKDPFTIPLKEKVDTLLGVNAEALKVKGVSFVRSFMSFVREHKFFASTEGSYIEQTLHRCYPSFSVTAINREKGGFASRNSYAQPMGKGYEYVADYPWIEEAKQAGEDAVEKLSAPTVEPGPKDLILHPDHLWLTIHESVGHPTELDRALGMEANYAGTSFLTTDKRNNFQFGSEIVNFVAEKTHSDALATCGYDDDGVKTTEWNLIKNGIFVDYQTTRDQAHWLGHSASYGCSYAQSWEDVPFQRMPNINLVPSEKPLSLAQLISDTEDAILVRGRGSYSIDHQRYNFQFGGQTFYEIKQGKIVGMLRDVAYQARTPDFWNACDAICSQEEYELGGTFNDGKGEPGQSNAVSHGCPPARFRQINTLNTARTV